MGEIVEKELSYAVVGVAMEVHRKLGPGLDEFYYHQAMIEKFRTQNVHGISKPRGKLTHKECFADGFEADFLVEKSIILELKHLDGNFCPEHFMQIISYLKHWNVRLGILLDFGKESLVSQRVVYSSPTISVDAKKICDTLPTDPHDALTLSSVCDSLARIGNQYGLGYRDTTYRSLVQIELESVGLTVRSPTANILIDGLSLGSSQLRCLIVNETIVLLILALRELLRPSDRAIVQSYLRHLGHKFGLLVNFGKKQFEARQVWLT